MQAMQALLAASVASSEPSILAAHGLQAAPPAGVAVAIVGILRALISEPVSSTYRTSVVEPLERAGLPVDTFIVVVSDASDSCGGVTSHPGCGRDQMDNNVFTESEAELRAAVQRAYAPIEFRVIPERDCVQDFVPGCEAWNSESTNDTGTGAAGPRSVRDFNTRILQQWATNQAAYERILAAEETRGQRYAWILKTRTDVVFFQSLGSFIASSARRDRVYAPRNGMSPFLDQRCQTDLLFWCPRELCRPYFMLLEIFSSQFCRGAARSLDNDTAAVPSIFAQHGPAGGWVPNGVAGPPSASYWLPYTPQTGTEYQSSAPVEPVSPRGLHIAADYWWVARYSQGRACTSWTDGECCGLIDDSMHLAYAVALFNDSGAPDHIDCEVRMTTLVPPVDDVQQRLRPTIQRCERMSALWGQTPWYGSRLNETLRVAPAPTPTPTPSAHPH